MAKLVYLKPETSLSALQNLLKRISGQRIVLVVPKNSQLLASAMKLRMLKTEASKLGREVIIATADKEGRELAMQAGFSVIKGQKLPRRTLAPAPRPLPERSRFGYYLAASGGALIILFLLIYFLLPGAQVVIRPQSEPITRDFEIRVDSTETQVDASALAVPGRVVEMEVTDGRTVPATGSRNVGMKASGFVNIYNFSKNTLILRAKSTTLTGPNGQKYAFIQDVGSIRPTARIGLEDQEVDPLSLIAPAPVVAADNGEDYNLAKGTRIEIQNEVFGSQPEVLYAVVADENISGGTNKIVKVISEKDVTKGLEELGKDLIGTAREKIKSENADLNLLDSGVVSQVIEQASSQQPGKEASEFEVSARVRIRGLVYNQAEVLGLITDRMGRLLPDNKKLLPSDPDRLTVAFSKADLDAGLGILAAHYESTIVYTLNPEDFVSKIRGKTAAEIRELLLSRAEIREVEITLSPFWVRKAPQLAKKIYIQVLDQ